MPIDGIYKVEIDTPMGKMEEKFTLKAKGSVLTGKVDSQMGSFDINGKVKGDQFSWESDVESPMGTMHLTISGKVTGNDIAGEVKAGDFGSSPFKGKRV
jgi:cytoskeletal protein CcmA (bactofilin family)